ncbi:hypothetical protein D3Z45_14230 [Lachnospiraceae bacterium]|nr:hypothetical protein [Lachnospiraceae bacterium]
MNKGKTRKKVMKRRLIPAFLMLSVGLISSIVMRINHYETNEMLSVLLGLFIVFYIVGSLFEVMLNVFDRQNQPAEVMEEPAAEGEGEQADMEEGQVKTEG